MKGIAFLAVVGILAAGALWAAAHCNTIGGTGIGFFTFCF